MSSDTAPSVDGDRPLVRTEEQVLVEIAELRETFTSPTESDAAEREHWAQWYAEKRRGEDPNPPIPGLPVPTFEELLRHGEAFGADCVVLTAEQYGLARRDVLLLKLRCSELKPKLSPKGYVIPDSVGKKLTAEERRDLVSLLHREGRLSGEISAMTGYSASVVASYLQKEGETLA